MSGSGLRVRYSSFNAAQPACACCQAAATTIAGPTERRGASLGGRGHADADVKRVVAAAPEHDATQRADVAVIAAPREREMTLGWQDVVGGIEIHPAQTWTPDGEP